MKEEFIRRRKEFLEGLRALCDEKDIILIFDEIQCGMGRTGYYFAWQSYGVKPDVMTCAKALGCGVPVGAFVLGEKAAASLVPGDHGTTYGGNPFVCAAVSKVFDIFEKDNILAHVQELTPYLEEKLDALVDNYPVVAARRGKGFMQGLVIEGDSWKCRNKSTCERTSGDFGRKRCASSCSSACDHKRKYRRNDREIRKEPGVIAGLLPVLKNS